MYMYNDSTTIFQQCTGIGDVCPFKPNYLIDDLFFALISVCGGFFFSFAFVSHFIHYREDSSDDAINYESDLEDAESDLNDDAHDTESVDFADKYYEELNQLELRDVSKEELDTLQFKMLDVETPDGLVKINYNNLTQSFWYYTDHKNIPYKYLDTVARYYTIEHNCRQICVNYKEEVEKGISSVKDQMENEASRIKNLDNEIMAVDKKSVFAQFKNYKTTDAKNVKKKYYVLTDKSNIFKFAGSLNDYELRKRAKLNCVPTMDYSTFKQMCEQKNNMHSNETTTF